MSIERKLRLEELPGWVWDVHAEQWDDGINYLTVFAKQHGHCRVPQSFITENGFRLGQWVSERRKKRGQISPDRKAQLEEMPEWAWDKVSEDWENNFRQLNEFVGREGHCRVPANYRTSDGRRLGRWVLTQRARKDVLSTERKERLEAVAGWVWNALTDQWDTGFLYLKEFADCEGHCRVPGKYRTSYGYALGQWIATQRTGKDVLSTERKERLEAVPGWVWNALADKWETGFRYLSEFSAREGHCKVPALFVTTDGYRLGSWVSTQRATKNTMQPERIARLEKLPGWVWRVPNIISEREETR